MKTEHKNNNRNCPCCGRELFYKNEYYKNVAEKRESVCKSCANRKSSTGRKIIRYEIKCKKCLKMIDSANYKRHFNSCIGRIKLVRKCSECNQNVIYKNKKSFKKAIQNNSMCFSCSGIKKYSNENYRKITSDSVKLSFQNPIIKQKHSNGILKYFDKYEKSGKYNKFFRFVSKDYYTDIELIMKNILDDMLIYYKHNCKIGKYWADFLIYSNIIIECDGEYWHKNRNKDKIKDEFLTKEGYCVYRFKEKDIKLNINKIKKIIGRL